MENKTFLVLDAPSRVWTLTATPFECFYCRLTNTLTLSTTDQWLHPQIRTTAIGKNNWLYEMTSYRALLRKEYKFMDLIDCIVKYWCIVLINYVRNNAILFESTKSCLTYNQKYYLKQLRKWPYKKTTTLCISLYP